MHRKLVTLMLEQVALLKQGSGVQGSTSISHRDPVNSRGQEQVKFSKESLLHVPFRESHHRGL